VPHTVVRLLPVELRLPMLRNSSVIDYLNMPDEGGSGKGAAEG